MTMCSIVPDAQLCQAIPPDAFADSVLVLWRDGITFRKNIRRTDVPLIPAPTLSEILEELRKVMVFRLEDNCLDDEWAIDGSLQQPIISIWEVDRNPANAALRAWFSAVSEQEKETIPNDKGETK